MCWPRRCSWLISSVCLLLLLLSRSGWRVALRIHQYHILVTVDCHVHVSVNCVGKLCWNLCWLDSVVTKLSCWHSPCNLRPLTCRCCNLGVTCFMWHDLAFTHIFQLITYCKTRYVVTVWKLCLIFLHLFNFALWTCKKILFDFFPILTPLYCSSPLQIQNAERRMNPSGHLRHPRVFAAVSARQLSSPTGAPSASPHSLPCTFPGPFFFPCPQ